MIIPLSDFLCELLQWQWLLCLWSVILLFKHTNNKSFDLYSGTFSIIGLLD